MLPTLGHWGSAGHDGHGDGVREASYLIHRGVRGAALHWRFSALSNKQELPEISTRRTDRHGALRRCRTGNRIVSELAGTSDGQSLKPNFHLGISSQHVVKRGESFSRRIRRIDTAEPCGTAEEGGIPGKDSGSAGNGIPPGRSNTVEVGPVGLIRPQSIRCFGFRYAYPASFTVQAVRHNKA